MARPLWRLRACPERAGAALGQTIEAMGSLSDTVELERRTWLTHYVVDDRIIAAALAVAGAPTTSPEARIYALRTLTWQKAPGHPLTVWGLTDRPPPARGLSPSSSYTNHYYTDLGYGSGEHPWPVLGKLPDEDYVARMDRFVNGIAVELHDQRVANARAWFLWYDQDLQLTVLLDNARNMRAPRH